MENFKMPHINSAENLRRHRTESDLRDLNKRLHELHQKHDIILKNSFSLIDEMNKVTTNLDMATLNIKSFTESLNRPIDEFEKSIKNSLVSQSEYKKALQAFRELNESTILKESLLMLKHTKTSLKKCENFLNVMVKECTTSKPQLDATKLNSELCQSTPLKTEDLAHFVSCYSSEASVKAPSAKNAMDRKPIDIFYDVAYSLTDIGYQGDIENSDYKLFTANKKLKKHI